MTVEFLAMKYVALLRGIGPGNPNMSHDSFRKFFGDLGFANATPLISSGNIIFETEEKDSTKLEKIIEEALPKKLGFARSTIIRSQEDLKKLIAENPFAGYEDSHSSTLNVTFLKNSQKIDFEFPYQVEGKNYKLIGMHDNAVFTVINLDSERTPDLMVWLEKQFGKEITTRTWKTVNRIAKKMEE